MSGAPKSVPLRPIQNTGSRSKTRRHPQCGARRKRIGEGDGPLAGVSCSTGACGSRSLSILAATVLLSVGQFSPANAATISLSGVNFGIVAVGSIGAEALTAILTPDAGQNAFAWN